MVCMHGAWYSRKNSLILINSDLHDELFYFADFFFLRTKFVNSAIYMRGLSSASCCARRLPLLVPRLASPSRRSPDFRPRRHAFLRLARSRAQRSFHRRHSVAGGHGRRRLAPNALPAPSPPRQHRRRGKSRQAVEKHTASS